MKHIFQYFSFLLLFLLMGCQDEEVVGKQVDLKPGEHLISFSIPEPVAATRAMGDAPAASCLQNLHVLVFDENGLFLANQVATEVTLTTATEGTFKVDLPQSDVKRILHFVAGNVAYGTYSRKDTEGTVLSKLSTTDQEDAYWQRVEVEKIDASLATRTGTVSLVRNFAKISVVLGDDLQNDPNFRLVGYAVVNFRESGSVAPYVGDNSDEFADFTLDGAAGQDVYTQFTQKNPNYFGHTLGNIKEATPEELEGVLTNAPKYIYEQQQVNNPNPAYVLVRANYERQDCYYKLDIVRTDDKYITSYLNIYRNFHYTIRINKVVGRGSTDIEHAMKSVASNNLSASVEVSEVNRIEDGQGNMLEVQTIDTLLVHNRPVQLHLDYEEGGNPALDKVIVTPVPQLNTSALQSVSYRDGIITVTPADNLPASLQTQELVVSTPTGLSRRIFIKVRQPYVFDLVDCQEQVEQKVNALLGVGIRLPQNMPIAVFPLTLYIEPDKKSIYPNADMNSLPVEDGEKTFTYVVKIAYNDYRQSRSFYLHFKSNMAESATSIKVSNPYFEDRKNTCSFTNTTSSIDKFTGVKFGNNDGTALQNMDDGSIYDEVSFGPGKEVILEFDLKEGHQSIVGIHPGDFLEFVSSSTGSAVEHESNGGLAYSPNDPTKTQQLTFRTTADFVGGTLQLYSLDYQMTDFTYRNPPVRLQLKYESSSWGGTTTESIQNDEIQLFNDPDYSGSSYSFTTDRDGYITLVSFVNRKYEDVLYFQYRTGFIVKTTYRGEITIRDIIEKGTLTLRN